MRHGAPTTETQQDTRTRHETPTGLTEQQIRKEDARACITAFNAAAEEKLRTRLHGGGWTAGRPGPPLVGLIATREPHVGGRAVKTTDNRGNWLEPTAPPGKPRSYGENEATRRKQSSNKAKTKHQ